MNRRTFICSAMAAVPLAALPSGADSKRKDSDDVITFRELGGTRERIEFEDLRIGDIAVFVSPITGPHEGRWKVCSKPERVPFKDGSGRWTWGIEVLPA